MKVALKFPFSDIHSCLFILGCLGILSGCASTNGPGDDHDPLEAYNRAMYAFNDALDKAIMRPVAETYQENVPNAVQTGVSNFFSNLDDVFVLINDLLQFKFEQAVSDLSRLIWNSTVGLFGLIDVATPLELPKHNEDFGQTLATWGVGDGPYIVLPFFGPSTLRDTGGLAVEIKYDPLYHGIDDDETYWGAIALRAIDKRVKLLSASKVLEQAAIDPYIFVRDAYLQHRRNLIYDGNPPREEMNINDDADADLELELELELQDQEQKPGAKPASPGL